MAVASRANQADPPPRGRRRARRRTLARPVRPLPGDNRRARRWATGDATPVVGCSWRRKVCSWRPPGFGMFRIIAAAPRHLQRVSSGCRRASPSGIFQRYPGPDRRHQGSCRCVGRQVPRGVPASAPRRRSAAAGSARDTHSAGSASGSARDTHSAGSARDTHSARATVVGRSWWVSPTEPSSSEQDRSKASGQLSCVGLPGPTRSSRFCTSTAIGRLARRGTPTPRLGEWLVEGHPLRWSASVTHSARATVVGRTWWVSPTRLVPSRCQGHARLRHGRRQASPLRRPVPKQPCRGRACPVPSRSRHDGEPGTCDCSMRSVERP